MPHTPGPWSHESVERFRGDVEAQIPDSTKFWIVGHDGRGEVLALVDETSSREAEANACLFAAGPELLASAKEFVALYENVTDVVSTAVRAKVDRARAAIAKAEGR